MLTGRCPSGPTTRRPWSRSSTPTRRPSPRSIPSLPESVTRSSKIAGEGSLHPLQERREFAAGSVDGPLPDPWDRRSEAVTSGIWKTLRKLEFSPSSRNIELCQGDSAGGRVAGTGLGSRYRPGGETSQTFGIIVRGFVEVSIHGRPCAVWERAKWSEKLPISIPPTRRGTPTVTRSPPLRSVASALALSSEELLERMRNGLIAKMMDRMHGSRSKSRPPRGARSSGGNRFAVRGLALEAQGRAGSSGTRPDVKRPTGPPRGDRPDLEAPEPGFCRPSASCFKSLRRRWQFGHDGPVVSWPWQMDSIPPHLA